MSIELLKFRNNMVLVWCFVLIVQGAFSQNLATWELSSATGSQTSNTPSILTNGINAGLLERGAGITVNAFAGSMNSNGWFSSTSPTTLSEAITNNDYYQFTITVADGYKAKVTGIMLLLRSSNTGPNKVTLRSSVDNFAADLGTATVTTTALLETMSFTNALTNLTGTVTFRLYGYGSAANAGSNPNSAGTLRIGAGPVATDNDLVILGSVAPTVNLSASSSSGSEANKTSITLTATTTSNVAGDQTVEVSVTGNGITSGDYSLSATKITILSGTKTGSVTLTIVDDFEAEATETATITLVNPSSGLELGTTLAQTVEITDNDAKGVILVESENTTKVTEGGVNDSYTIVLNSQPTANVSIGITTGVQLTATPATLTFTTANWSIPQTVTISAVDDATVEGNHAATISHTVSSADAMYNGLTVASVSVMITDNDQAFNCPTLTTQNSTSFETCNDNSTNNITVETTRNDLSVKLVYFSSAKKGTEMYTGGTVIGNATAPSGASAPFLVNFNDLIFPANQTGADVTYYVYAILDLEDAELTEASCRPSLQFVITIKPQLVPLVALSSSDADNTIEAGTGVTFTAIPTNGGVSPSYRWKKNNVTVGDKSATYTDDNLVNGDQITVDLLSSTVCAVPATVTSSPLAMTVMYPSTMCVKLANECVELGGTYSKGGEYNQRPTYSDGKGHTIFQKDDSWWLVNGVAGVHENVLFKKQYALGSIPAVPPTAGWSSDICKNATFSISFEACVCVSPTAYIVTGGGSYCAGGDGVLIGLSSSEVGMTYQLKNGTSAVGSPVSGTGSALTFGAQKATGTYTVEATRTAGGCTSTMTESVNVTTEVASVGGKVTLMTGTALICKGATGSTSYELSGQIGSVVRWESSSSSSFEHGKTIANTFTSLEVNLGEVTETTYYRAVVQNGLCSVAYSDVVSIAVESLPTKFNVTGGGSYCAGGDGVLIGISSSEVGMTYQLKNGMSAVGSPVSGTGSALTFGAQKATGIYTVEATRTAGGCAATMTESVNVTTDAASVGGKVTLTTGTALICKGATGSTSYELSGQIGSVVRWESSSSSSFEQGKTIANTSTSLQVNLGEVTETTYYRAVVQNGLCSVAYSDVVSITVESLPTKFNVTGGGSYCAGGDGVVIGLSNSEVGVTYQLKNGTSAVGSPVSGTGDALTFGAQKATGTYTVEATRTTGGCTATMTESVKVTTEAASVGGKVTLTRGTALICKGATGSTSYELSGQIGSVVRWESSSSSSFEQGKTIANTSTSLQVNLGEVTETTYYRAVVQNGLCNVAYSDVVSITVESLPTKFNVTGGGSICTGSTGAVLLSGSEVGAVYSLMRGANEQVGDVVAGTGASLSFGGIAKAGTYTIKATKGICVVAMEGEAVISLQAKPTISLTTLQQTLNEGAIQQLCDTDANPVNTLQWAVTTGCGSGNPSWRVQAGSNAWSDWSTNPPVSQFSNNQVYRYQAACDTQCPTAYTNPIEVTIRYRASVPQNVSLVIEGVKVTPGETKEICTSGAHSILVTASCGADEQLLYSVDGGEYLGLIPTGLVDNQYHNYRVRCRKTDGAVSCVESESGTMRLKLVDVPAAPNVSITPTASCDLTAHFGGQSTCGNLKTAWYNAATNVALAMLPTQVPTATVSYYARCQTESGCLSEKSNTVTFTLQPTQQAPVVTVSEEMVCTGKVVKVSSNCPAGSTTFWNTGVTTPSFEVAFNNVTKQTYWAKCVFEGGCQSIESVRKDVYWNAFVVTIINLGESKSAIKTNNRSAWASQFVTRDGGPELEQSTQANPTLYFVENGNKVAPRYWTMNVDACALGTAGSVTFDVLATPEVGVIKSFNTHENNAPYFMYANRDGWTELYGPNHPAYGFYEADGNGGNVYDAGLPKGLYKLSVRYWDMKGWGSSYPATRKPQGNVLAYQEYWFRIQSKDGVGVGAAREGATTLSSRKDLSPNSFATVLPNPVTNILHLQVQDSKGQVVQSTLTDASGREVFRRQFVAETNTHQEEFGVRELPTGVYFLKVSTSGEQTTLKVVKVP